MIVYGNPIGGSSGGGDFKKFIICSSYPVAGGMCDNQTGELIDEQDGDVCVCKDSSGVYIMGYFDSSAWDYIGWEELSSALYDIFNSTNYTQYSYKLVLADVF